VPKKLQRYYGLGHLHYITCSCHHRWPLLRTPQQPRLLNIDPV
jgi:hypothetical protein